MKKFLYFRNANSGSKMSNIEKHVQLSSISPILTPVEQIIPAPEKKIFQLLPNVLGDWILTRFKKKIPNSRKSLTQFNTMVNKVYE